MESELQHHVDALGVRLGRPVMVEDRGQRLLSYSPQFGTVDRLRIESILQRETAPAVIEWYRQFDITRASAPVRIPANPALDMLARVCVPITYRGTSLGFLWLIDGDGTLDDVEIASAISASHAISHAIYKQNLVDKQAMYDLRNLLSPNRRLHTTAAEKLVESEVLVDAGAVAVLVLAPIGTSRRQAPVDQASGIETLSAMEYAIRAAQREAPPRHALGFVREDHAVLLVTKTPTTGWSGVRRLAEKLTATANSRLGIEAGPRMISGVGEEHSLRNAWNSYWQARQAVRIADFEGNGRAIIEWGSAGVFRALVQLPDDELKPTILDPRLTKLLESELAAVLVSTLEAFLDAAGNVQQAAKSLRVHRATLYYRLGKIEELSGANLNNGSDRLAFHVGLKIAKLAKLYRWN